jgi:hypothetical protein
VTREAHVMQMATTLSSEHLRQSLELIAISKRNHDPEWRASDDEYGIWPNAASHLYALSSMMHAFAALEGHVNWIAQSILRDTTSRHFMSPESRTLEFQDLAGC